MAEKPTPIEEVLKNDTATNESSHPVMHTYESDLSLAMNTTDATVVQELLQTSKNREDAQEENQVLHQQRGWYTTGSIILILLALAALGYGVYYYQHLTVTVLKSPSVGVFQNGAPLITADGDSIQRIDELTKGTSIPENKPVLIPLVTDSTTLTPLDTERALQYMHINATEPFVATLSLVRLGLYNTDNSVSPFLLLSTDNPEIATKEFLIAEPQLLSMVSPILGIDTTNQATEVAPTFTSSYMYNLPVRILKSVDLDTHIETILLYYGYATDHTIVVATNPTILKAVYDTIIRQQ